jgi:3-phenylpropionate/cinnamic acid dioxygenase small subunit
MQLGFVGTGTMGNPMARCLLDAGHGLTVYDVRRVATINLCERGARWADNPCAVEVTVKCRFLIYRNRVETETDLLVGKREDVLGRANAQWKITQRKIILDQNVLLAKNLIFFF